MKNILTKLVFLSTLSFAFTSFSMEQLSNDLAGWSIKSDTPRKVKKKEKTAKKKKKTERPKGRFSWDHKSAENASTETKQKFGLIMHTLKELQQKEIINDATYRESLFVLSALLKHAEYNRKICEEFWRLGRSDTYAKSDVSNIEFNPDLHPEEADVVFPEKAMFFAKCVFVAYTFAARNNRLYDFFTYGLGSGSGCMEGRIGSLNAWLRRLQTGAEFREPKGEGRNLLQFPVRESLYRYFHSRSEEIETILMQDGASGLIEEAVEAFSGMVDAEGQIVTWSLAHEIFLELYKSMSPTKLPAQGSNSNNDEPSLVKRKLSFN